MLSKEGLEQFVKENKLSMNYDDIQIVQHYFTEQQREPTITEIKVLDTYWSDHCRHTTFTTKIHDVEIKNITSGVGRDMQESLRMFESGRS